MFSQSNRFSNMIKINIKSLLLALVAAFMLTASVYGQGFIEGQDYEDLGREAVIQSDGRVEVVEFFWFGCPSCFRFEPQLLAWNIPPSINFVNVPATLVRNWRFHAHVYYTMELFGLKDQLMQKFYDALHVDRDRIFNAGRFKEWALKQDGVDADKLAQSLNSFAVLTKVSQADLLAKRYGISGVPTLIVGGKYKTSPSIAGSGPRAIQVAEFLAQKILSEQ